mmetsp:Transcript_2784/g.6474  ORF Transcript_2784/g.6474 Transcript_2784/m.6474 type:complete len:207 (-) Transcript_2784:304-924(-)
MWPCIFDKVFKDAVELILNILASLKESRGRIHFGFTEGALVDTEQLLNLFRFCGLITSQHMGFWTFFKPKLVYMYVPSERDQPNGRILGQVHKRLDQGILELCELLWLHARIHDKQEYGTVLCFLIQDILHCREIWHDFCWQVLGGDVCILVWKVIRLQAEGASPHLGHEINTAVRVQDCLTAFARDRWIGDLGHPFDRIQRGVKA